MENKIAKNMRVRVKNDLSKTYAEFGRGEGGSMERMKNKIFPVCFVATDRIKIHCKEVDFRFSFHPDDVDVMEDNIKIKYPKPEAFNPKFLDI